MPPSQLSSENPPPSAAVEVPKKTLSDLKNTLDSFIKSAGLACKGMVITGLDIDKKFDHTKARAYSNSVVKCPVYYVAVSQELNRVKFSATLIVGEEFGKPLLGTVLAGGKKIEITVATLEEGKNSMIMIHAGQVRSDGESDYEIADQLIKAECTRLGYYQRVKRPRPPFFIKIGLITSSAGSVESDIAQILTGSGLKIDLENDLKRCASAEEMTLAYKLMDASRKYDAICFFRGGREDVGMSIFRDLDLFKAVVEAQTYTVSGLCHEQDHPLIEGIVDEARNTPTAFGEMVTIHNANFTESIAALVRTAAESYKNVVEKIEKDHLAHKKLSDSYFSSCVSSVRESVSNQCSIPFNSIVKMVTDHTRFQSREIESTHKNIAMGIKAQGREHSQECVQRFKDLANIVLSDIKQTVHRVTSAEAEIRARESKLAADADLLRVQIKERKTERSNNMMKCALIGLSAAVTIGIFTKNIAYGFVAGVVVGVLAGWMLLRKR